MIYINSLGKPCFFTDNWFTEIDSVGVFNVNWEIDTEIYEHNLMLSGKVLRLQDLIKA